MVDTKKKKPKKPMTTIWVEVEVAEILKNLGRMGDTYSAVIRRLVDGKQPDGKMEPRGDE